MMHRKLVGLLLGSMVLSTVGCTAPPTMDSSGRRPSIPKTGSPALDPDPTALSQGSAVRSRSGQSRQGPSDAIRLALTDARTSGTRVRSTTWTGPTLTITQGNGIGTLTASFVDSVVVSQSNRLTVIIDEDDAEDGLKSNVTYEQFNVLGRAELTNTPSFTLDQINEFSQLVDDDSKLSRYGYRHLKELEDIWNVSFYNWIDNVTASDGSPLSVQQATDIVVYLREDSVDYFAKGPVRYSYTPNPLPPSEILRQASPTLNPTKRSRYL